MFMVDSVGRSGGLVLLWKEDVNLNIQNYSRRHINALVKMGGGDLEWKFTCFMAIQKLPSERSHGRC
jgi:hypothetical protein